MDSCILMAIDRMAQEEYTQKRSNSSGGGDGGDDASGGGGGGGGRSSKRVKQKKVPQRGLGVAQLEKIRLEELQKKEAALQAQAFNILSPNAIISPSDSSSSLALQSQSFRPIESPPSIPMPPTSPNDLPSSNSLFRPSPSMPNMDVLHKNQIPFSKPLNLGGGDVSLSARHGSWPTFWNGGYPLEGENQKLDNHGLSFRSNGNLPFEFKNPMLPLPNLMQRFQQSSCSSMVNVSSGISPSSSVLNYQMEPPSFQNYSPLRPEEEKMVSLKRQYPFSFEIPTVPPFSSKFRSSLVAPFSGSDQTASSNNGSHVNLESNNLLLREGPSSSNALFEPILSNVVQENASLDGDFLTLAPPASVTSSAFFNSKHEHPLGNSGSSTLEFSLTSQESNEEPVEQQGASGSTRQPFYTFMPPAELPNGEAANSAINQNSAGESVDLNLKL